LSGFPIAFELDAFAEESSLVVLVALLFDALPPPSLDLSGFAFLLLPAIGETYGILEKAMTNAYLYEHFYYICIFEVNWDYILCGS
jgi:hypothetical protein